MEVITASEAKHRFGEILMKAQRAPITINKNGKAVAVMISADEYAAIESARLSALQVHLAQGADQAAKGLFVEDYSLEKVIADLDTDI